MSQRDHGLMEPDAAQEALGLPASPPARDSMEDADPSLTRKRPRLDSGSKDTLAMPHEQTPASTTSTTSASAAPPREQQVEMTIRLQPPSSSHAMDAADDATAALATTTAAAAAALREDLSPETVADSTEIDFVDAADGSADSPPVIAIDDDDDSDPMIAGTLSSAAEIDYTAELSFQRFPFAQNGHYIQALQTIAQHFREAGSIERAVLPELTVWLIGLPTDRPYWNSYYRNRYTFWEEFGVMVQRILYRRINLGVQFRDDDQSEGEIFTLFFEQYLRICAVMMQVDADMLSTIQQGTAPDVLSCRHIRHFAQMIRLEKPPLLVMLERDYRVDTNKMSLRLTQELVRADGIKSLFAFADAAHGDNAVLLKRETAVCLTQLIHGLGYLMRDAGTETGLLLDAYYHDVLQFFRRYSADLQNPSKVTDIGQTRDMVHSLANLLGDLCVWDSSLAAQLAEELLEFGDSESPTTPTLAQYPTWADRTNIYREDPAYYPILIPTAWKFKLLRKYLVKGRMELRVMSIGAMDNALVEIWRVHNGDPLGIRHPVMQYLADFLLHERVTDYIISVDSHPQIIQRSGNVVGFLVVTRRYSSTQTDAIWNTVSRSSDPRVVSATQTMLNGIFGLMCGPDLVYFVSKFYDLPIETYSMEMLRTFKDLTFQAQQKTSGWSNIERNARPWNVLVRLLQDTSPGKDTGKVVFDVHNGAYEQLCLIRRVISDDERHEICRNCATLIASRSPKSTGCVRIISVLTAMLHIPDKSFFKENPDVTRHILEETCAFVKDVDDVGSNQAYGLQFRLDLLSFLIHATDAIPQDLHQNIWDHLVGKHAQTNYMRDLAWSRFGDALRYNFENDFCQQLISSYVPSLEPQYYTLGLFNFVAAYRFPPTKRIVATPEGDKEVLQARGADLLWSLVLSAPPHTIEDQSTQLLAARYLELGTHVDMSVQDVEACHIALVEQCMDELLAAYKVMRNGSGVLEDDQMDIALSKPTRQQNERRFTRTILFLRTLLMSIRTRPEFNRGRRSDSKVEPLDLDIPQGDTLEIRYSVGMEKHSLLVGVAATLQDLYDRLCQATGYSKVSLFAYGQRIILAEKRHASIVDLRLPETVTTVQMAPGCVVSQPRVEPSKDCSVFETTLLNQFEKLFGCMDADDAIGLVLYEFLLCFPFPERIPQAVEEGTSSVDDLFPPGRTFQAKYAAETLRSKLKEQTKKNTLNDRFLGNAVQLLDKALLNPVLISESLDNTMEYHLACVLVRTMLDFLKERPSLEISSTYFSNESLLVERLLSMLDVALKANLDYASAACDCYSLIVEASLHSRKIWEAFIGHANVTSLHKTLLLEEARQGLREQIATKISSVCGGALPSSSAITESDTAASFWEIISSVLPEAARFSAQSEQLFEIADQVFRQYDEHHRTEEALRSYVATWSGLLLEYDHVEIVGRDQVDFVVFGFTKLLLSCIASLKSFKRPLNSGGLVQKIWTKFLFVPRVVDMDEQVANPALPVLESKTRRELYDLVLALAEDRPTYSKLLELAKDVAFDESDMTLRPTSVDRANEIRSPTGYVGLFNPRAICYMNSLLTQLFMNVNFRKFMLGLNVADRGGSQRLLHETQRLFANLQNSYRKSADPREFAACVKVPEGTPIDINVQMDADEFYNLLFDQWEAQMLSPATRQQFRSFYGGQTVTQIKSKECEHVSERVESFFVVQCDVQGKSSLNESLQAYVEGDVMEGDNKYKCESCGGKFVDAVKRTCLKDVPDNLMFHLKRFDFDLVEMRRSKINDLFEFPTVIDMSNYKIDHLSDPSQPRQEDIFELVGVLIHQGTSENGHYYSYIRERPSPPGSVMQWLEFNDRDVDGFDPSSIPAWSFGGMFADTYPQQHKNFSAYMLFYQRQSAILKDRDDYMGSPSSGVAKVPVPTPLDQALREDNEGFIREYSLYDPCHTKFARQLLANLRTINHGTCSEDHHQESQAISFVLEYLCQTLFRMKNDDLFEEIFSQLRRTMLSCPICCQIMLKWLATQEYALSNTILQCLHQKVRSSMRAILIDGLRFLREKDPAAYGIDGMDTDGETGASAPDAGVLVDVVYRLQGVMEESYFSTRGWDDLYLTLCQLVDMGSVETSVLLSHRCLEFCLRMFCLHASHNSRLHYPEMWRIFEKRKRIYNRMIEFVYMLVSKMDINLPPVQNTQFDRLEKYDQQGSKFALSREEKNALNMWHDENRALAALDKMLELFDPDKTEVFYPGEILRWMLQSKDARFLSLLHTTVFEGIYQLSPPVSDPYVRAALPYCEASTDLTFINQIIDEVAKAAQKLKSHGGPATLGFFRGLLHAENDVVLEHRSVDAFYEYCLHHARKYIIPLLAYDDDGVRRATATFLQELYTQYKDDTLLSEHSLKLKYKSVRLLAGDMCNRITDEHELNTSRSCMEPMISICTLFVQLYEQLQESEDPTMEALKHSDDALRIQRWNMELAAAQQHWVFDEDTPVSTGEGYDHSDYGSESDMGDDILPDV